MKDRYDGAPGKEAAIQNTRQKRFESEHNAKDAFVKKQQNELARHAGKHPKLEGKAMEFNAYMCNNGEHAQAFGKELARGIDEVAFPVRGKGKDVE